MEKLILISTRNRDSLEILAEKIKPYVSLVKSILVIPSQDKSVEHRMTILTDMIREEGQCTIIYVGDIEKNIIPKDKALADIVILAGFSDLSLFAGWSLRLPIKNIVYL